MRRWTTVAFIAAIVVGGALRLSALTTRPLHHDEGVNALFLLQLVRDGAYRYDPSNYHGPLLYYMVAPLLSIFGLHTTLLRLWPALIGTATIAVFWPLRGTIGRHGAVVAAWLLALSPTSVYFSRDLIHEAWLVGGAALAAGAMVAWGRRRRPLWIVVSWVGVATMFATKETTPLLLGAMVGGAAVAGLVVHGTAIVRVAWDTLWRARAAHFWGVAAALVLLFLLYTSFLSAPSRSLDFFRAYQFWTTTGVEGSGHEKPWVYFFGLLWRYERMAWIFGLGGFVLALVRREAAVGLGAAALALVAAHAAIPYKTPWLAIGFLPPLAASAGYLVDRATASLPRRAPRIVVGSLVAAGLIALGYDAYRMSFVAYDDDSETFVYSQTRREFIGLVAALDAVVATSPAGLATPLAVMSSDHFPLNWYTRDMTAVGYWESSSGPIDDGLVLIKATDLEAARERTTKAFRVRSFTLRPGVDLSLLIPEDLFEAARGRLDGPEVWTQLGQPRQLESLAAIPVVAAQAVGLVAHSFDNADFGSKPILVEPGRPPEIHYDHGANPEWSRTRGIEWRGLLSAPVDGVYMFALDSDDGSTLELDDRLIVDNWGQHAVRQRRGMVFLESGYHRVRLRFVDYGGGAQLSWSWRPPEEPADVVVPPIVLSHIAEPVESSP